MYTNVYFRAQVILGCFPPHWLQAWLKRHPSCCTIRGNWSWARAWGGERTSAGAFGGSAAGHVPILLEWRGTFLPGARAGVPAVSKIMEDSEDCESKFHGLVAAFCISLVLNGALIAIIVVKRKRRANPGLSKDQLNKENSKRDGYAFNEACYETSYHELGEINKSETYESSQYHIWISKLPQNKRWKVTFAVKWHNYILLDYSCYYDTVFIVLDIPNKHNM